MDMMNNGYRQMKDKEGFTGLCKHLLVQVIRLFNPDARTGYTELQYE
jgi:hypothetical protein